MADQTMYVACGLVRNGVPLVPFEHTTNPVRHSGDGLQQSVAELPCRMPA